MTNQLGVTSARDHGAIVYCLNSGMKREETGKKKENEQKRRKELGKRRADRLRKRERRIPEFLLGDADQESETRMSKKNALRTGRRQAVE
ncbi:hypothetical protein TNCV_1240011 [Trichonephila clavipes]|nr:hypothetical protein TNCV_1240011 [Trichonephila clavipes]